MKTLKITSILIVLLMSVQVTFAQIKACCDKKGGPNGEPPKERMEQMFNDFATEAKLTDSQKLEAKKLFEAHHQEVKAKREANRTQMEDIRKGFEAKLGKVLNEEQMAKFRSMRGEGPHKGKGCNNKKSCPSKSKACCKGENKKSCKSKAECKSKK